MTETLINGSDRPLAEAADWLARLDRPDVGEAEFRAFDAWLEASEANQAAYDRAIGLWSEIEVAALELDRRIAPTARTFDRRWAIGGGLAAAVLAAAVLPWSDLTATTTVYQTGKGERSTVVLEDGTRIDLNAASRLTVKMTRGERRVVMDDAQAIFDVARNPRRPFVISAGDRTVRVLGTRFDVRYRDGDQSVTVDRGLVEVAPAKGSIGATYRLTAGQRLDHENGDSEASLKTASPAEVMSWTSGRLVYRDATLAEVAADINRYASHPIRLADARTAALRFSGVLNAASGDDMARTLILIAPVTSTETPDGLVLRAK